MSREFLEKVILTNLGAARRDVMVRPGPGLDNAVVSLGRGGVLLATSDPVSVIPSIGTEMSAWLSVHLLASDLTTSGVDPQFAMFDLNLPPEMTDDSLSSYVKAIGEECRRLGIAIVGGHTGRYPGSGYTVVGGGVMMSVANEDAYVTPGMAKPGDSILMTKGAAIGATAVLANSFPAELRARIGRKLLGRAKTRLQDCSTVADAHAAASVGLRKSVTSMHDATEGGVLGGLSELASASATSVIVELVKIHIPDEAAEVCGAFGLDPLTTLSEGTLIITCKPEASEEVMSVLAGRKIESYEIGRIGERRGEPGLWVSKNGSRPRRHSPGPDSYWMAYSGALARATGAQG